MANKIDRNIKKVNPKKHIIAGYEFNSKQDAQIAKDELNAIKYMSDKTDAKNPAQIYMLYNKILDKKLFQTQIGLDYLKELQQYLYINKEIPNDRIKPIPINEELRQAMDENRERMENLSLVRRLERESKRNKDLFTKAMILNILLVIAIAVMIFITVGSPNPNIINYENKLQDKYASWQEELESRETVIKQKEKSLNIGN